MDSFTVKSYTLSGISRIPLVIEATVQTRLPALVIVGLPAMTRPASWARSCAGLCRRPGSTGPAPVSS